MDYLTFKIISLALLLFFNSVPYFILTGKNAEEEKLPLKISKRESWPKNMTISFQEVLRIGSDSFDEENYLFGIISDIKVDEQGSIYVLDSANYRILKFSSSGVFIRSYGKGKGEGPGQFLRPKSIALDEKSNLYVADTNIFRITIFDNNGDIVKTMRTELMPAHLVARNNKLYLTFFFAENSYHIYMYNILSGELEKQFCQKNEWNHISSQAGESGELCADADGNLYYSYTYPYEIKKFSPEGKLLNRFSRKATFYKAPYKDQYGISTAETAVTSLFSLPNGIIVNVIRHIDSRAKKGIFFFDFFDKEGNWLKSIPATSINLDWIRIVTSDNHGHIYLDCRDPFPHIRKYKIEIISSRR